MALYKLIRDLWNSPSEEARALQRQRLIAWRTEPASIRIDRPTRLDRARAIGYRAKPGFIIVRQRLLRGGHERAREWGGRRSKNTSQRVDLSKNYQQIAQHRVSTAYVNLEVLNSYKVAEDGKYLWYEIILVDPHSPSIRNDSIMKQFAQSPRARAERGVTMADKRGRGLLNKGTGAEKLRPSQTANWNRRNRALMAKYEVRYRRD